MTVRRCERDCATAHKRRFERTKAAAVERCFVARVEQEKFVADQMPAVCHAVNGRSLASSLNVARPVGPADRSVSDPSCLWPAEIGPRTATREVSA